MVTRYEAAIGINGAADHKARRTGYEEEGRTSLWWGGAGAQCLGLQGPVSTSGYHAVFSPEGFCHPLTRQQHVSARRPGFAILIGVNKTVAMLDVLGRTDHLHDIIDAETAATMDWLDSWFQERGGKRGKAAVRTPTFGLTYAVTRIATSRAGDPSPQDHVLVANVVEMLDAKGGFKALDSAALRDNLEAATMVGRLASAARAIEQGYRIEPDLGPSGRRRNWRIVGIPHRACTVLSKRSQQIADQLADAGGRHDSYRERTATTKATQGRRRWIGPAAMRPHWRDELTAAGLPVDALLARLNHPSQRRTTPLQMPTDDHLDWLISDLLGRGGPLDQRPASTRGRLVAELAPRLYGYAPSALDQALDRILTPGHVVLLEPLPQSREPAYGLNHRCRRTPTLVH